VVDAPERSGGPPWPDHLVEVVRRTGTLCLNVDDPGWDDARGYLFDETTGSLYLPVSKKHLNRDLASFQVLLWSQPRILVTGELLPASSEHDIDVQLALASQAGMPPEKARYMLLDQRSMKPRKTRFKLVMRDLSVI
jgi:hypothetical protein